MKIRNSFVSNSSSSSFVVITTEEEFNRTMAKVHPYVQAVINDLDGTSLIRRNFLDHKIVVISGSNGNYDSFEDMCTWSDRPDDIPEDKYGDAMEPYMAVEEFINQLDNTCTLYTGVDC